MGHGRHSKLSQVTREYLEDHPTHRTWSEVVSKFPMILCAYVRYLNFRLVITYYWLVVWNILITFYFFHILGTIYSQ